MSQRFSHFFAFLLLLIMPIQGFASVSMAICHHQQQVNASITRTTTAMPCHEQADASSQTQDHTQSTCQQSCAALCASLSAYSAPFNQAMQISLPIAAPVLASVSQHYTSITPANLQRPPIRFS